MYRFTRNFKTRRFFSSVTEAETKNTKNDVHKDFTVTPYAQAVVILGSIVGVIYEFSSLKHMVYNMDIKFEKRLDRMEANTEKRLHEMEDRTEKRLDKMDALLVRLDDLILSLHSKVAVHEKVITEKTK